MRLCEVDDVDIIADARAVVGCVIVPEDVQLVELPACDLRNVGQKVVRDALRVLADQPRRVCAERVEVAQDGDAPLGIRDPNVLQDALDHQLGLAVGIGR